LEATKNKIDDDTDMKKILPSDIVEIPDRCQPNLVCPKRYVSLVSLQEVLKELKQINETNYVGWMCDVGWKDIKERFEEVLR
jgi:hypothetical protein